MKGKYMKKTGRFVSVILSAMIAVTSMFSASVPSYAAEKTSGIVENGSSTFTGKYLSDDTYSLSVQFGMATFVSEQQSEDVYKELFANKIQAVADVSLLSDGKNCYGFLVLDYGYAIPNPYKSMTSTQKDENVRRYVYPVTVSEEDLEDGLTMSKLTIFENYDLMCKGMNTLFSKETTDASVKLVDGKNKSILVTGVSCNLDLTTENGKTFLANLQKCKKGYYAKLKLKNKHFYALDGDDAEFGKISKISLASANKTGNEDSSKISITSVKITDIPNQTYTGKAIKPDVKMIINYDYQLKKGTDYKLSYKNNKSIGTATVTIKMIGKYTGSKQVTFNILPKTTSLKASKTSSKFNLSWSKISGIDGYQIQYSTDGGSTFKKAGSVSSSKTSTSLSLDTGRKHVFRIRTYKKVGKNIYYSAWSDTVTVKK